MTTPLVEPPSTPTPLLESTFALRQKLFTRRAFLGSGALALLGLTFYSGEIARHHVQILDRTIVLPNLPEDFRGFRLVLIADLHYGGFSEPGYIDHVIHLVNGLRPDAVAIAGDFVSSGQLPDSFTRSDAWQCAEHLRRLTCPQRIAILGNHDVAAGAGDVSEAITQNGITLLRNSALPIERNGRRLWFSGVEDVMFERPRLELALPRAVTVDREPVVLLCHEPDFAYHAVDHRVGLMLSGHTHGGQVRLPGFAPFLLPTLGQKYIEGHFQLSPHTQLYVNRGIGTVGLPFRLFCPPEITVLTLIPS